MQTAGVAAPLRERPEFDSPNILWFFGAFTAAAACDAVIAQVHGSARGVWILLVSLAFLAAFALLATGLLRAGWLVPGGVLVAMAVTFVAPAGSAFERLIGVWHSGPSLDPVQEYEGFAFALVLAVAVAGLVAFAIVRFPFILAIVAFATFLAGQLLVPVFVTRPGIGAHATALMVVGGVLILVGLALDVAGARREAFWWHLVGLTGLAVGLAYHAVREGATWGWVMIFVFGTIVLLLATVLHRATWGVFGVAGFYAPIAHYLDDWLGNLGTAFALAALGIVLVAIGQRWRRRRLAAAAAPACRDLRRRSSAPTIRTCGLCPQVRRRREPRTTALGCGSKPRAPARACPHSAARSSRPRPRPPRRRRR